MKIENPDLLREFRECFRCELCGKPAQGCDPCHIFTRGAGRLDIRCNLVSMHRLCHSRTEGNREMRPRLLQIAAIREYCLSVDVEPVVQFLRHQLDKHDSAARRAIKIEASDLTPSQRVLAKKELALAMRAGAINGAIDAEACGRCGHPIEYCECLVPCPLCGDDILYCACGVPF